MWSFAAMVTLMFRQAMPLMVFGFVLGTIGAMVLKNFAILPGVSLLASPFLGETIFTLSGGLFNARPAYAIALPAQAAFAAIFFVGACRRYRGSYLTTLSVPLGLALVTVWGLLTAVAIWVWPRVAEAMPMQGMEVRAGAQVVAGVTVAAMLMIVPIQALVAWDAVYPAKRPVRLLVLGAAVMTGMISAAATPDWWLWSVTLVVLAGHAAVMYQGLRMLRGMTAMTVVVMMVLLIFALWLLPILMELARWNYLSNNEPEAPREFTVLSTLSPLGLLITAWKERLPGEVVVGPWAGLVWQWMVAGGLWLLAEKRGKVLAREEGVQAVVKTA
jgi:hypothetical protein